MPTEHQITDPLTGETVTYINPWTYDQGRGAWVADDINFVSGTHFNNLLRYGQPFDPGNHISGQFYRDDLEGTVPASGPTVIFQQENVITQGFGSNVNFDDFDLVRDLRSGEYSDQLQDGQTYTLSDLQELGISPPVIGSNGQDFGDHALSTNLYGSGTPYPGSDRPGEMAYIFGSVRFRISENTTFRMENGELVIDGRVELFDDNFNHETSSLPVWLSAIVQIGAGDVANFEQVFIVYEGQGASRTITQVIPQNDFCFLGDTAISMWPLDPNLKPGPDGIYDQDVVRAKIWKKPIRDIRVKDIVVAYDKDGNLVPDVVSRTMRNDATHILDFWGTGVTPGHAYLCGDGKHEGEHIPLIDILRQDGAIVLENGAKVRAATNWPVGSLPDQFIWVLAGHGDGQKFQVTDKKQIRIGTRTIAPDGTDYGVLDHLVQVYGPLSEDGISQDGIDVTKQVLHWPYGDTIPNPEDYILQRSDLTLEEIYAANEWEQIGTRMPPPSSMVGFNPRVTKSQAGLMLQASTPAPNIPPAFAGHPDVPSGTTKLNRRQRKAMEDRKHKTARVKMRKLH